MTRHRLLAGLGLALFAATLVPFLQAWRFTQFVPSRELLPDPSPRPTLSRRPTDCPAGSPIEILDFEGSCAPLRGEPEPADVDVEHAENTGAAHSPRPALPDESYTTLLQVAPSSLGRARVRSRLVFPADDERNVLTTVPDCSVLRLAGPMKNSSGSQGIGWSVRLRDPTGRTCQGFLSATVLGDASLSGRPTGPP